MQEGLTNALKYSADATATLGLSLDARHPGIQLTNPAGVQRRAARRAEVCAASSERAAALGGTTTAGPHDGRWTLSVAIPAREAWP